MHGLAGPSFHMGISLPHGEGANPLKQVDRVVADSFSVIIVVVAVYGRAVSSLAGVGIFSACHSQASGSQACLQLIQSYNQHTIHTI